MMFARGEEVFAMVMIFTVGPLITWMALHYNHRRERLKTMQKALEAGSIDDATRRMLLEAISADAQQWAAVWRGVTRGAGRWLRALVFIGGWLTFVIGGGLLAYMALFDAGSRYDMQEAAIAVAVGFALVTLPLAMRELNARAARAQ